MAQDRVEAVERALTLLDAFSEGDAQLSLAEMAQRTGFHKSTILRLAKSLERFGYLTRDEAGDYRLGPSLWRLGALYRREFDLEAIIRPVLKSLRDHVNEAASYYVLAGHYRVCLYRELSTRAIRHHVEEGTQMPLDRGAAGEILRAFGPETPEGFKETRARGWAVSLGQRDPEVAGVAVPVFGGEGELHGALQLSGLVNRFDEATILQMQGLLQVQADQLRLKLGGR